MSQLIHRLKEEPVSSKKRVKTSTNVAYAKVNLSRMMEHEMHSITEVGIL